MQANFEFTWNSRRCAGCRRLPVWPGPPGFVRTSTVRQHGSASSQPSQRLAMELWDSIPPHTAHPTNTEGLSAVTTLRNWPFWPANATLQHWLQSLPDCSEPPPRAGTRPPLHCHLLMQMPAAPAQSRAWPYKQAGHERQSELWVEQTFSFFNRPTVDRLASKSSSNAMANFSASSNSCL